MYKEFVVFTVVSKSKVFFNLHTAFLTGDDALIRVIYLAGMQYRIL